MVGLFRRLIQTVDSHTEGNSTRVITGGYPIPPGRTLLERRRWLWQHDDGLRRLLNFEPRGHGMMCSVLLMPPVAEDADFSVIIMEQDEYVPMCGHCVIGTAMTVVATGMVPAQEPVTAVTIETPPGPIRCRQAFGSAFRRARRRIRKAGAERLRLLSRHGPMGDRTAQGGGAVLWNFLARAAFMTEP